jgi:undecaprenyl-diphosphatase
MNEALFTAMNGIAGRWPIVDAAVMFCAGPLIYLMVIAIVLVATLRWQRLRGGLLLASASAIIARFVIVSIVHSLWRLPRPAAVLAGVHQLVAYQGVSSFPSGHATFAFAFAVGVLLRWRRAGWYCLAAAAMISIARVIAGVHWPSDIAAGAVIGTATAVILGRLSSRKLS